MEKISKDRLRECLMEKEYMVLLFSSAMDVNSVLAENALESLMDSYSASASFYKSDITEDVSLAQVYSVFSTPRILVFRKGNLLEAVTGVMSHAVMRGFLDRVISHQECIPGSRS